MLAIPPWWAGRSGSLNYHRPERSRPLGPVGPRTADCASHRHRWPTSAERVQPERDPPGEPALLGPGQGVEQAAVDVAVEALQLRPPGEADPAGGWGNEPSLEGPTLFTEPESLGLSEVWTK